MDEPRRHSNREASTEQDPFVPVIIQSLRDRGHLPVRPLRQVNAWDPAKEVMEAVEAERVFAAWQEVKQAREQGDPLELRVAVSAFQAKLTRWLNS
jgi:hypothetical protein